MAAGTAPDADEGPRCGPRRLLRALLAAGLLLAGAGAAHATTYTLPGGRLPSGCSAAANVVSCGSLELGDDDSIVVTTAVTLNVGDFEMDDDARVNAGQNSAQLTINAAAHVNAPKGPGSNKHAHLRSDGVWVAVRDDGEEGRRGRLGQ